MTINEFRKLVGAKKKAPRSKCPRGKGARYKEDPADAIVRRCREENLPPPVREYRFAPPRKWRLDLAWPEKKVALEIEGAVFRGGRHTRGIGFIKDAEKYNTLTGMGWLLLRTTPDGARGKDNRTGDIMALLRRVLHKGEIDGEEATEPPAMGPQPR